MAKRKRYGFSQKRTVEAQYRMWRDKRGSKPKGIIPLGRGLFKVKVGYRRAKSRYVILGDKDRISYRGKGTWSVSN